MNGTVQPTTADTYSFTLTDPTTVALSSSTLNGATLTLTGPDGTVTTQNLGNLASYYSGLTQPLLPLAAGSYVVTVTGNAGAAPTSYGFALTDLAAATPITAGVSVAGDLQAKTSVDAYTVTAAAGTSLRVQTTDSYNGGERIVVLDPNGKPLTSGSSPKGTTYAAAIAGTYTILVEGRLNYYDTPAGDVSYTLLVNDDPAPQALAVGAEASGTLADGNALATYTITLPQQANLLFDSLSTGDGITWTLSGPDGFYASATLSPMPMA